MVCLQRVNPLLTKQVQEHQGVAMHCLLLWFRKHLACNSSSFCMCCSDGQLYPRSACAVMVTHAAAPALKPSQPSVSQIRCVDAMAQLNQHECTVMDSTMQLDTRSLKFKCLCMYSTQTSSKNNVPKCCHLQHRSQ